MWKRALAWIAKNERHLGAIVFIFGFVTDLLTFLLLDVSLVSLVFAGYLALGTVFALLGHASEGWKQKATSSIVKALPSLSSLVVQYATGGILSGCLIFYTKSSSVMASWPFLLLLAAVFIGNEYFRKYREHLAFQTILLFFGLYAYSIFALPLLVNTLGPLVFLGSTAISLVSFSVFLYILWKLGKERFASTFKFIIIGITCSVTAIVGAYFTGLVPPIPLALSDVGIYQSLEKVPGGYQVQGEGTAPWWQFWPRMYHHKAGTPLYAYSSVFAPVSFSTSVVHVWQKYNYDTHTWVTESRVAFSMSGGRSGGYRGYSIKDNPSAGKWRISIETTNGQVIGREVFFVQTVSTLPSLETIVK
ncbi:DUF2914 domain-containing protein [Patescibacteria group bacterium]|nr:DUF2914 domain-containing protein [Patescibacteria group bacterium]MBU1754941.1 DUF2914 domain-containing protein [Patescibacteria group bacterium]